MRILNLVHQYLPERVGGTELYTRQLATTLAGRGHPVAVFYRREGPGQRLEARDEPDGVRVWAATAGRLTPRRRFRAIFGDAWLESAFRQALDDFRPDLVHIQHLMGLPAALVQPLVAAGLPYLITLHDYWWVCANAQLLTDYDRTLCAGPRFWLNCARCAVVRSGQAPLQWLSPLVAPLMAQRQRLLRPVLAGARYLVAPTAFVRQTYADLGLDVSRAVVVGHGISLPPDRPPPSAGDGRLRVLYLGGLAPQKGVHILIEAVTRLPPEAVTLTIHGDEAAFPDYVADLKSRATHPGIHFGGRLPHDAIWPALASADLVAVPTLWYETASLIVQEAFAAGVPVVASRLGALPERIQEGIDGLLLPPGDVDAWATGLGELGQDRGRLDRLRQGIRPVRTAAEHAADILALYESAGG